jgi:hypothetical protein
MWVLWMPIPQNIANASTKFSSFLVNAKSSNLFTNCNVSKASVRIGFDWKTAGIFPHLYYTYNLSRGIFDGHAENTFMFEIGPFVYGIVKALVTVSVGNVQNLKTSRKAKIHILDFFLSILAFVEKFTSPLVATYPVTPTLMGNLLSKGLTGKRLRFSASAAHKNKRRELLTWSSSRCPRTPCRSPRDQTREKNCCLLRLDGVKGPVGATKVTAQPL